MSFEMALLGAGVAGSAAGSKLGSSLGGGSKTNPADTINNLLGKALNRAVTTNNQYSQAAIGQQNTSLQAAIAALTQGTQKASDVATSTMNSGLNAYKTAQQPYATAGYDALDAYKQSLGLSTPQGGSAQAVQNQEMATNLAPQLQSLLGSLKGNYSAGTAPDQAAITAGITPEQLQQYISGNISAKQSFRKDNGRSIGNTWSYSGAGANPNTRMDYQGSDSFNGNQAGAGNAAVKNNLIQSLMQNQGVKDAYGQSLYNTQNQAYQQQSGTINQVNQMLAGMTPQQMQALAPLLKGKI